MNAQSQPSEHSLAFMELVQLHERMWGTEAYPNRPSLADLLNGPIVVMWVDTHPANRKRAEGGVERSFTFAVYADAKALSAALLDVIMLDRRTVQSSPNIARIFLNQKPVEIMGVRLLTNKDLGER
jgi:hypothetical protein